MSLSIETANSSRAQVLVYELALKLIDSTKSLAKKTVNFEQKITKEFQEEQVYCELAEYIQDYVQVDITINVIEFVFAVFSNEERCKSMISAATSARKATFNGLLKINKLLLSLDQLPERIKNTLETQVHPLLLQNQGFNEVQLAEKKKPIGIISTSQFLNGFEATAREFGKSNNLHIDMVWESMFKYAITSDYTEWTTQNLFNKQLSWQNARQKFLQQFPDPEPQLHTGQLKQPLQKQQQELKQELILNSDKEQNHQAAVADNKQMIIKSSRAIKKEEVDDTELYPELLLALKMKPYDNIRCYNRKYLYYCKMANMDLKDNALIARYVSSILKKYKDRIRTTINQKKVHIVTIVDMMKITREVIEPLEKTSKTTASSPCSSL